MLYYRLKTENTGKNVNESPDSLLPSAGAFRSRGDRDCAVGLGRHSAANRVLGFEDFVFQMIYWY